MNRLFSLGKKERLKSQKQIDFLFAEGEAFSIFPLRIFFRVDNDANEKLIQAGFSVGKKYFKKSVHRNRIKRLLREAYRLQKQPLYQAVLQSQKQLNVFFIYTGKELPGYQLIADKMNVVLEKLTEKIVQPKP